MLEGTKNTSVTLSNERYNAIAKATRKNSGGNSTAGYIRYLIEPFIDLALKGEFERITLLRKKLERDAAK